MTQKITIAIPMAGFGSRMRPQTWSKAKPLIALAGKTVLDYVLGQFTGLEKTHELEYVFIVGPNQLDQIKTYSTQHHNDKTIHYVVQEEMRGQSDALHLARNYLTGPMLMSFSDTLIETGFDALKQDALDGIIWVKKVADPRRFGVAEVGKDGLVTRLIEKPTDIVNNLALVGFYYFKEGAQLMNAIETQKAQGIQLKGEYFLSDAVSLMLKSGAKMRTNEIAVWLDAGLPSALLETNRHFLSHGHDTQDAARLFPSACIVPPVYIHPEAVVENSVIGPHVSIGKGCRISGAVIKDSVIDSDTTVVNMLLQGSILGQKVQVSGKAVTANLGDNTTITYE
ncbi:MAG: sugar phosphate nucleotidyltransferase [Anaerolineaceae bacterium]